MRRKTLKLERGNITLKEEKTKTREVKNDNNLLVTTLAKSLGLGFSISIPIVLAVILGTYLDRELNLYPKLTLFFVLIGFILGIYNILRIIKE